jgi:hypothetical protein
MMKRLRLLILLTFGSASALFAQDAKPIVGYAAVGWVDPQGKAGDIVDSGWGFSGGATFFPARKNSFGLRLDLGYNQFLAKHETLESGVGGNTIATIHDGKASMTTLGLDAVYDFSHQRKVGGYIGAGAGMYTRRWQVTTTTSASGTWCDPLTGVCVGVGGNTLATENDKLTKIGFDAVAAITFALSKGQIYTEAAYRHMDSSPATTYVPVLVGYRW